MFTWRYDGGDPSLVLFTQMVARAWGRQAIGAVPSDGRVLNLGCMEEDFCGIAQAQNQTMDVVGVDWRLDGRDACNPELFPEKSFDLIVALGAIEHFGLGYYGDPRNELGDIMAAANIGKWLRPGGYAFFDVPWTPNEYFVSDNKHWRCYSDAALQGHLINPMLYTNGHSGMVLDFYYAPAAAPHHPYAERPTTYTFPFDYAAVLVRRTNA